MSVIKHFAVDAVKSEVENIEKVEFYWSFMTSNIWNKIEKAFCKKSK